VSFATITLCVASRVFIVSPETFGYTLVYALSGIQTEYLLDPKL
jgi:hypothetical protein